MQSVYFKNVLLFAIALFLLILCIENYLILNKFDKYTKNIQKVELYRNGEPVGKGLRQTRVNSVPVEIIR